jgi:hypothetical protein
MMDSIDSIPTDAALAALSRFTIKRTVEKLDHLAFLVNKLVPAKTGEFLDYSHVARFIVRECRETEQLLADLNALKRFTVSRTVQKNGSFTYIESELARDDSGFLMRYDDVARLLSRARGEIQPATAAALHNVFINQ